MSTRAPSGIRFYNGHPDGSAGRFFGLSHVQLERQPSLPYDTIFVLDRGHGDETSCGQTGRSACTSDRAGY